MVRTKFRCVSRTELDSLHNGAQRNLYTFHFSAVTANSPENKVFWEWTPSGSLQVQSVKNDSFKVGTEYYLDISEAN